MQVGGRQMKEKINVIIKQAKDAAVAGNPP